MDMNAILKDWKTELISSQDLLVKTLKDCIFQAR